MTPSFGGEIRRQTMPGARPPPDWRPINPLAVWVGRPYITAISLRIPDVFRFVTLTKLLYSQDFGELTSVCTRCAGEHTYMKENETMTTGTVKWFNPVKGYGFITPDDGSKDAFVHISAVERAGLAGLNEGQQVEYELQRGQNGKTSAENLKVAD